MSQPDVSSKHKSRKRSGKKSQKISFDEEIVPKSIAQQFKNTDNKNSIEPELHEKSRNKSKQKTVVETSNCVNSESLQPKKPKRNKKVSQSEKSDEANENTEQNSNCVNSEPKKPKRKKKVSQSENSAEATENTEQNSNSVNSESLQPKKPKRNKKASLCEQSAEANENTEREEHVEPSEEQPNDELDPSNPVVKSKESKRSQQRKKHQQLLFDKKVKVDLVLQEKSLNYLSRWKHDRNEWKFEKLRQVWLQQSMFDCDKVPERLWETLVEHFSSAKGQIRKTILDEALKIIKENEREMEQNKEEEEKETEDANNINKAQRARDIIQCLQE